MKSGRFRSGSIAQPMQFPANPCRDKAGKGNEQERIFNCDARNCQAAQCDRCEDHEEGVDDIVGSDGLCGF